MTIQSYVTDEELDQLLRMSDTDSEIIKQDHVIILLVTTTGLWAEDLIRIKLTDITWWKVEIRFVQSKTGRISYPPLIKEAREALQDYILNARPRSDSLEVFLHLIAS